MRGKAELESLTAEHTALGESFESQQRQLAEAQKALAALQRKHDELLKLQDQEAS